MHKLLAHVLSLDPDAVPGVSIQDMAVCQLWCQSPPNDAPVPHEDSDRFHQALEHWLQRSRADAPNTEGRRHQTLLRELIDRLQDAKVGSMTRDELELLETVYSFTRDATYRMSFQRIHDLIHPFIETVRNRIAALDAEPGLPGLSRRLHVVDTEDIQRSPQREIKVLAGVEMPHRGPLLSHKGHLRVLGDVPDNATIVIESGHCIVDGYVMGRIAASGHCEVRENIGGVVIVRDGDVRARSIIDNATVVSKCGSVYCRTAQNPNLIFAGMAIDVRGETNHGRFISQRIHVENMAHGGDYHVGEKLKAGQLRPSDSRPLNIVFRRRFSCKDYGETPGREMAHLLSKAMRLREKLYACRQRTQNAGRESEEYASSALMYLLGGDKVKILLDDIVAAQRRLDILNRVILSLHAMYTQAETDLETVGADTEETPDEEWAETWAFEEEESLDGDLAQERERLTDFQRDLTSARRDQRNISKLLSDISERLTYWLQEARDLRQKIAENEKAIQKTIGLNTLGALAHGNVKKVVALRQVLAAAKDQPENNPVAARMKQPFIQLMLRNIRSRVETAAKDREKAQVLRVEFDEVREALWNDYQVRIEEEDGEGPKDVSATGRYWANVKLYSDPQYLESDDDPPPNGGYIVTKDRRNKPLTYVCRSGRILEEN